MSKTSDLRVLMEHAEAGGYWEEADVGARHPTHRMNSTSGELEVLPGRGVGGNPAVWGPGAFPAGPWRLYARPTLAPATFQECYLHVRSRDFQQEPGNDVAIQREGQPDTVIRFEDVDLDDYLASDEYTDWVVRANGCFVSPNGNGRK